MDAADNRAGVQINGHTKLLLSDGAHDGQVAVGGDRRDRLRVVGIAGVDSAGIEFLRLPGAEDSVLPDKSPDDFPLMGVVAVPLRQNVLRAVDRLFRRAHPVAYESRRPLHQLVAAQPARLEQVRERLQPLFDRHPGPGVSLQPVRAVEVLHGRERLRSLDPPLQLLVKVAAFRDQPQRFLLAVAQLAGVVVGFLEDAQLLVSGPARLLLAVAGDERNGCTFLQKPEDVLHVAGRDPGCPGERLSLCHHGGVILPDPGGRFNHPPASRPPASGPRSYEPADSFTQAFTATASSLPRCLIRSRCSCVGAPRNSTGSRNSQLVLVRAMISSNSFCAPPDQP